MNKEALESFAATVAKIKEDGLYKGERVITSKQKGRIDTTKTANVINMCANNYLGMADNKELIEAGKAGLEKYGYGMASVRFICGTQSIHKELEAKVSEFLGTEDTILYSSCFDANGGLFETLLDDECAVISDELNHASIIDGVRLCKAKRFRYKNNDMADLRRCLEEAKGSKITLIATDGVFSMDSIICNLKGVCDLADEYGALVMVDDSHAVGFIGKTGRGTPEFCGVSGRVDIITGTFGKALGGASGGYTSGRKEIIELLRQKSRPYLFSNTLAPVVAAGTIKMLDMLMADTSIRDRLEDNTKYFRTLIKETGYDIIESTHPIVAIMFYDAKKAAKAAELLLGMGIYVTAFSYPVVPKDRARIRVQISAAHTKDDLKYVAECFAKVKAELGI